MGEASFLGMLHDRQLLRDVGEKSASNKMKVKPARNTA